MKFLTDEEIARQTSLGMVTVERPPRLRTVFGELLDIAERVVRADCLGSPAAICDAVTAIARDAEGVIARAKGSCRC